MWPRASLLEQPTDFRFLGAPASLYSLRAFPSLIQSGCSSVNDATAAACASDSGMKHCPATPKRNPGASHPL
jgi:hypothetical protein